MTQVCPRNLDTRHDLFTELEIPWHAGIGGGPTNHLLSSQVQCVNALGQMVHDPERIKLAFGAVLDIAEVLKIEPGRYLTFEYIGPSDLLNEDTGSGRTRGAHCTSIDAAFEYRTSSGDSEIALVEWKYTESYPNPTPSTPQKKAERTRRYLGFWEDNWGPLSSHVLSFDDMLHEPFYQLMRQQFAANELEKDCNTDIEGPSVVRVVHILSPENLAYQQSLPLEEHKAAGGTVYEIWQSILREPDRFIPLDPAVFLDPAITSDGYVDRYSSRSNKAGVETATSIATKEEMRASIEATFIAVIRDAEATYGGRVVLRRKGGSVVDTSPLGPGDPEDKH